MQKYIVILIFSFLCHVSFSQTNWRKGGNSASGVGGPSIGTNSTWNSPLLIQTNGIYRAVFTTGSALSAIVGNSGDGLRILNPNPLGSSGNLDLLTTTNNGQNETHIVWGSSGQISGQYNRFELRAFSQGFYFNTQNGNGMYKFASENTVHAFVGTNKFWRIGKQAEPAQIQATRQLEVADNVTQFRLRKTNSAGYNQNVYTDFYASNFGLDIKPFSSGAKKTVFIHKGGATLTSVKLNVNGNGRFRYVPQGNGESILLGKQVGSDPNDIKFRRLAFSGNSNEVLLGNGTWGTLPTGGGQTLTSNEGITIIGNYIKLGEIYNNQQTKPLISDREIALGGYNLVFSGKGAVGIGQQFPSSPTEKLDVVGNARFRGVPASGGQSLMLGYQIGANVNDIRLSRLVFPNDNTQVLLGDGTFGSSPGEMFVGCTVTSQLQEDKHVDLNDNNIYFVGNNSSNAQNNVGFGIPCGQQIKAKVDVYQAGTGAIGGQFIVNSNWVVNVSNNSPTAVRGFAGGNNALNFIGVHGVADGNSILANYGIYGEATNGNVNYAGYFNGNVYINGTITGSDSILKTNINGINNSMDILNQLQPKTYNYNQTNFPSMNFDNNLHYGLIAQEVQQVLPNLVSNNIHPADIDSYGNIVTPEVEFLGLDYQQFIPILIGGIQEQQTQIETITTENDSLEQVVTDLNDRLTQLENCLSGILPFLCELSNSEVQNTDEEIQEKLNEVINVELNDRNNIVLNQNVPNPFAERTVISYSVPASVGKAQIHFYNGMGQLINTVEITERGKGEINVYANDLSSGVYTYSLVADGKIVSTKRMVKQ